MINCTIPTRPSIDKMDGDNLFINDTSIVNTFTSDTFTDVKNTLTFLTKSYGRIVYVKIINNKVYCFNAIKDDNYTWNKMFSYIKLPKYGGRPIVDNFVTNDFDIEIDSTWVYDMFNKLCTTRTVSDCEFFVNVHRHSPMVTKDRTWADYNMCKTYEVDINAVLDPHTVLSWNTSDRFRDIAIPTYTDYNRMNSTHFGIDQFRSMKWEDKKAEFLFHGDVLNVTNQRINLVRFMKSKYSDICNVGITDWYLNVPIVIGNQIRYYKREKELEPDATTNVNTIAKYRYIFAIDSVCSPEELSTLLFTGSCIIRVESVDGWKLWFDHLLQPGVHYISVNADLSNLQDVIEWCIYHPDESKTIGMNSRHFACKYLNSNSILDYLQNICNNHINRVQYRTGIQQIQAQYQYHSIIDLCDHNSIPWSGFMNRTVMNQYVRSWEWNTAMSILVSKADNVPPQFLQNIQYDDVYKGINDAFVGLSVINRLTREVPNFQFTYYAYATNDGFNVVRERLINAVPMNVYIRTAGHITDIMIQLFLTLQLAYERFCFSHGRLDPNKIMIQTFEKPVQIKYLLSDKTWIIDTRNVAIITDFSESVVLSNYDTNIYKPSRMFIGDLSGGKTLEDIMHVPADNDVKHLVKRLGKKFVDRLSIQDEKQPIEHMPKVIPKTDIINSDIRFGSCPAEIDVSSNHPPPRLIYDKMTDVAEPHEKVVDRVMNTGFVESPSVVNSVILQYEIVQTLRSTLADFNIRFSADIITTKRVKTAIEFVKTQFKALMDESEELDVDGDPWGLRMFIRMYLRPLFDSPFTKAVMILIKQLAKYTVKDAIQMGIKNTHTFYKNS